jgi:hypothetical protein
LIHPENFVEKFLDALGFLSSVIAFFFGLIVTMTWLHFLVPLGLNGSSGTQDGCLSSDTTHSWRPILNTMKSTGTKEFPIHTGISSAVPTGNQID